MVANKVTRSGNQLTLNGSPFRIVGLDMWPMAIASWCQPPNYDQRNVTQISTVLADIRKTAPHVNAIKVWFYQQFARNNGAWDYSSFDAVLAAADAAGFKVIANLEDSWSYERTGTQSPSLDATWYNSGYKSQVLTKEFVTYRQWVSQVVSRYANDPRILMWELVAEPNAITLSFLQDMCPFVRSLDPTTPLCAGEVGPLSSSMYALLDVASYHMYYVYSQTNWQAVQSAAAAAGIPWFMGEYGITSSITHTTRASTMQADANAAFAFANTCGFMYWQYAEVGGDQFNCTQGDPLLPILDSYVLAVTPPTTLPAPANPGQALSEQVSWDAVTGADHYSVQLFDSSGNLLRDRTATGLSWPWNPLTKGNVYKWHVAAVDASGNVGTYTSQMSFTAGG